MFDAEYQRTSMIENKSRQSAVIDCPRHLSPRIIN